MKAYHVSLLWSRYAYFFCLARTHLTSKKGFVYCNPSIIKQQPLLSENTMKFFRLFALSAILVASFAISPMTSETQAASVAVKLQTNMGDIILRLNPDKAPVTVENFLQYVKNGHYDGTIFHRVIKDFMIQGGGMDVHLKPKPTNAPIKNEASNGLDNDKYTVAMARTGDPNSATAQFFINVKDNKFLNYTAPTPQGYGYTVFGKVIKGQNVVDKIKMVPTSSQGRFEDVPVDDVIIEKATIVK